MIPNKREDFRPGCLLEMILLFQTLAKSYGSIHALLTNRIFLYLVFKPGWDDSTRIGVTNNIAVKNGLALITFIITQFTARKSY